jgi:hypothetical protein
MSELTRIEKMEQEAALEDLKKYKHVLPRIDSEWYQAEIDELPQMDVRSDSEDGEEEEHAGPVQQPAEKSKSAHYMFSP